MKSRISKIIDRYDEYELEELFKLIPEKDREMFEGVGSFKLKVLLKYTNQARKITTRIKNSLSKETRNTNKMVMTFYKALQHNLKGNSHPNPEELKAAIRQIPNSLKLGTVIAAIMIPGGVVTTVILEIVASRFGISIFPDSYKDDIKSLESS